MIDLDDAPAEFSALDKHLKGRGISWITSRADFNAIRSVCEAWYRDYRPTLISTVGELDTILSIDSEVDWLRSRVGARTDANRVRTALRTASRLLERELLPRYDTARWSSASEVALNVSEPALAGRLRAVDTGLADSYEQATRDVADASRLTYLGPAAEFREVLRGTIDHLAQPDDEIRQQPWYKGHEGKPTQAEKIRSILGTKDRADQPTKSLDVIDAAVGSIGRATYNRASRSVHTSQHGDRDEVLRVQGWVDVVLAEILP